MRLLRHIYRSVRSLDKRLPRPLHSQGVSLEIPISIWWYDSIYIVCSINYKGLISWSITITIIRIAQENLVYKAKLDIGISNIPTAIHCEQPSPLTTSNISHHWLKITTMIIHLHHQPSLLLTNFKHQQQPHPPWLTTFPTDHFQPPLSTTKSITFTAYTTITSSHRPTLTNHRCTTTSCSHLHLSQP